MYKKAIKPCQSNKIRVKLRNKDTEEMKRSFMLKFLIGEQKPYGK